LYLIFKFGKIRLLWGEGPLLLSLNMIAEESPDSSKEGTERKLRLDSVQTLYPHAEFGTSLETTRLESNRDEWK